MIVNRVNKMGVRYTLSEIEGGYTRIATGSKSITVNNDIHHVSQSWWNWQMGGKFIQVAFPYLSASQREFILTGITDDEWDKIFGGRE